MKLEKNLEEKGNREKHYGSMFIELSRECVFFSAVKCKTNFEIASNFPFDYITKVNFKY